MGADLPCPVKVMSVARRARCWHVALPLLEDMQHDSSQDRWRLGFCFFRYSYHPFRSRKPDTARSRGASSSNTCEAAITRGAGPKILQFGPLVLQSRTLGGRECHGVLEVVSPSSYILGFLATRVSARQVSIQLLHRMASDGVPSEPFTYFAAAQVSAYHTHSLPFLPVGADAASSLLSRALFLSFCPIHKDLPQRACPLPTHGPHRDPARPVTGPSAQPATQ